MHFRRYRHRPKALVIGFAAAALAAGSVRAQAPVLVKASFNRHAAYLREPVQVVYTLYTLTSTDVQVVKEPVFPNATLLAADRVDTAGVTNVTKDGVAYEARVIYRRWLLPLVAGPLRPEPLLFTYKAPKPPPAGGTLQDLMNQTDKDQAAAGKGPRVTGSSVPLQLTILPLPLDGQPADFSGAVGHFVLTAQSDTGVTAGRMAHLTVTVSGEGTLLPGERPAITWPAGFTGYDVTGTDKTLLPPAVGRTITFAFTAQTPGSQRLPPVAFTYFDPLAAAYKTIRTDSLSIDVAPGSAAPVAPPARNPNRPGMWLILAGFLLVTVFVIWWKKKRSPVSAPPSAPVVETPLPTGSYKNEPLRAGAVVAEPSPPPPAASSAQGGPAIAPPPARTDPFGGAAAALAAGQYVEFYKTLQDELWAAIQTPAASPYLGAGPARVHLKTLGWDPDRIGEAMAIFSACAVSMYTPVHLAEEARDYLERARVIAGPGGKYRSGPES